MLTTTCYCRYRANSPQKLPFFGEDIMTFPNPLMHHLPPANYHIPLSINPLTHVPPNGHNPNNAGWRCVPYNPMTIAMDPCTLSHHFPPWEPEQLPVNKGSKEVRSKMTLPKPVVVEVSESESSSDMDESSLDPPDGEDMEQEAPREENRTPPRKVGRPLARQVSRPGRRGVSGVDPRIFEDYRRFSGRSRRKTEFFGVKDRKEHPKDDGKNSREGRGPRQKEGVEKAADFSGQDLDNKLEGSAEVEVVVATGGEVATTGGEVATTGEEVRKELPKKEERDATVSPTR